MSECGGPPADVPGECNAHLRIADDYGVNVSTMRCRKTVGHTGLHEERYEYKITPYPKKGSCQAHVIVQWSADDRRSDD